MNDGTMLLEKNHIRNETQNNPLFTIKELGHCVEFMHRRILSTKKMKCKASNCVSPLNAYLEFLDQGRVLEEKEQGCLHIQYQELLYKVLQLNLTTKFLLTLFTFERIFCVLVPPCNQHLRIK